MPNATRKSRREQQGIRNLVVIGDTHFGCQLALMPPVVKLDSGGTFHQSDLQKKLWSYWNTFWDEWIPLATKGEDYIIVHNGDCIDGSHHNSVTQITHNIGDQISIAYQALHPRVSNPKCKGLYFIRGTEAHVGKSGQAEEGLAKALGAIPDDIGNHARWEMYLKLQGYLVHFTHHIGTTSSASYESTAVYKELIESFVEAARWGHEPPDAIIRSHRHREFTTEIKTKKGRGIAHVVGAWQLKTPFVYKVGMRQSAPQIGGSLIRVSEDEGIYIRSKIWDIERPKTVEV